MSHRILRRLLAAFVVLAGSASLPAKAARIPFEVSESGDRRIVYASCGTNCLEVQIGTTDPNQKSSLCGTIQNGVTFFVRYPSFINSAVLLDYNYKDWMHFRANGSIAFDPDNGRWQGNGNYCNPNGTKTGNANSDLTRFFTTTPKNEYLYFTLENSYILRGNGFARMRVYYTPVPACQDGEDNDRDGKFDYPNEPGCTSINDDDETDPNPKPICSDGIDNEGDGLIDYPRDPECKAASENYEGPPACQDGKDNDGDGKIDFPNEPGCSSRDDISERDPSPAPACGDGLDNDLDGFTDYPADKTCNAASENYEGPPPQCADGIDNDGNGRIDFPNDSGCTSRNDPTESTESCTNCMCGADLNGDGSVDGSGETASCRTTSDGNSVCPIQEQQCVLRNSAYVCPSDASRPCASNGSGTPTCSPNKCYSPTSTSQPIERTDINQPEPTNDGPKGPDGSCLGVLRLFPGQGLRCRKSGTQTAFQSCCQNRAGRLQDTMGERGGKTQREYKKEANDFAVFSNQCDIQDQKAAQLADSNYCIDLGEYCAEKWVFGCVQKAKSYCCFSSKLAKLIQEQGRAQIPSMGGFGSAKNPNCRGFTTTEFQSLDFSKIDLSSYYADFRTDSQSTIQQAGEQNAHQNTGR